MGGDLEHRIPARVHDGLPRSKVLLAEPGDDLGTGGRNVPQDRSPDGPLEELDHLGRKALRVGGERTVQDDAADLPVAGGGVLPGRALGEAPVGRTGLGVARHTVHVREVAQPEPPQVRRSEAAYGSRRVPQGVRPPVAVGVRVGGSANAERVAHHQGDVFHVLPRRHAQAPFCTARARGWAA